MLDDFILEQKFAYNIFINSIKRNKLSHAYIIESNGYLKSFDLALAFAKYIMCPNNYSNNNNCLDCSICKNINKNDFLDIKIIEAEGQWIKKNQLEDLQNDFSKKSFIGNKKLYIIKNAEKLNESSSNSLLKFLEEPEEGIIAILIVDNINHLLNTILSRCQIVSLKGNNTFENKLTKEKISFILNSSQNSESKVDGDFVEKIIDFISYYEENQMDTLLYLKKIWYEYVKDKQQIIDAFSIMILFYKDLLNFKLNKNIEIFDNYLQILENISEKNDINKIISKLNVIIDLKEKIKYNINSNMLMDKLIIQLERCE